MRKTFRVMAAVVALALAPSAMAQVAFDLKAAYALPMGKIWGSSPWNPSWAMNDVWSGAVPFELGVRYRFTPNLSAGVYFQYGPTFVKSPGLANIDGTSGYDMRTGLELAYAFLPDGALDPWFSLGTGWEWTSYSGTGAAVTTNGWEYLNVQAGLNVNVSRAFGIGPYVGLIGGTYSGIGTSGAASGWGGAIEPAARAFHGWFQFGLKATVNL